MDNLSVDSNGDIFAASFPHLYKTARSFDDPFAVNPPSAVFRIRKLDGGEYEVKKMLEDDGGVLPGSTVAVHDPKKPEKYFFGGG